MSLVADHATMIHPNLGNVFPEIPAQCRRVINLLCPPLLHLSSRHCRSIRECLCNSKSTKHINAPNLQPMYYLNLRDDHFLTLKL